MCTRPSLRTHPMFCCHALTSFKSSLKTKASRIRGERLNLRGATLVGLGDHLIQVQLYFPTAIPWVVITLPSASKPTCISYTNLSVCGSQVHSAFAPASAFTPTDSL